MMKDLPDNRVLNVLADQLGADRKLCLALSGGLDSTVLLAALVQLRDSTVPDIALRAIHVHHGLSTLADSWVAHCTECCQQLNVPLTVIYVSVDGQHEGIEAAARAARYQAFSENLAPSESLLTAQHLNDQCETLMLALKRGSGPAGLSAMAARAERSGYRLLRPFLSLSREQLEQFASQAGLRWIEDDSNQDTRFDRNFLRLNVLPDLYQRWPHFPEAVARSAALCAEQEALLDELMHESLIALTEVDGSLDISAMLSMSPVRRQAILRRWLSAQGARMPSRDQLLRIWDEVALSREDASPQLQLNAMSVRRFRQRLYLLPAMTSLRDVILPWDLTTELLLPERLGVLCFERGENDPATVRLPRPDESVSVRFQAKGMIEKVGREHARHIKKLWQELNVPSWQRERTPLVYYNEQLIAAPGLFITRQALAETNEPGGKIVWYQTSGEP